MLNAGVDDKTITDVLIKYADDVPSSNKVFTVFGKDPTTAAKLLAEYSDNAVELAARYGDDGFEALARFRDEAVDLLKKFGDHPVEGKYIGSYLSKIKYANQFERTKVMLTQGFETSRLANNFGLDIHIAGRLADTPDEMILRQKAYIYARDLAEEYKKGTLPIPDRVQDMINLYGETPEDIDAILTFWSKEKAAQKFGMAWPQVKISTGGSEVDAFINVHQWKALSIEAKIDIERKLLRIFNVAKVDFYQRITDLKPWELILSNTNPQTIPPPGSLKFLSDGTIIHTLLGN